MSERRERSKKSSNNKVDDNIKSKKENREISPETAGSNGSYVILRNQGLYSVYRKIIALSIFSFIMAVLGMATASYFYMKPVPPRYIPLSEDGKVIPLIGLDKPNQSIGSINEFAIKAIRAVNMYDYINWRTQLLSAQQYFTATGWNNYLSQFQASNTLNSVNSFKMIVTSTPTGTPEQVGGHAPDGTYAWRVVVPVKIDYISHKGANSVTNSMTGKVRLTIIRVPNTLNPSGIGIQIYQFIPDKGSS